MCPICDHPLHKQHSRDHVAWHFMEELKAYIIDPSKCPECSYTGDKLESVARHLALYHQKLDQFLSDTDLVAEKRAKAMAKPKKVSAKYALVSRDAFCPVVCECTCHSFNLCGSACANDCSRYFCVQEGNLTTDFVADFKYFTSGLGWFPVHHMRFERSLA